MTLPDPRLSDAAEPLTEALPPNPVPSAAPFVATAPAEPVPSVPVPSVVARRGGAGLAIAVAIVAILAGSALFVSGWTLGRQSATTPGTPTADRASFNAFWDAYYAISERYAGGEVETKSLVEGAIKGMIESLDDPYSSYLTSDEYRRSLQGVSGEFEGIGAEIATQAADGAGGDCATLMPDCRLLIVAPLAGSPAEKAGLLAGDLVLAADGESLDGLSVDQARDRIRGPKGSSVTLTIERGGGAPFDLSIVRDTVVAREVVDEDLAGGVGYLRLTGFSIHGADELEAEVAEDIAAGRTKLILDLRGNPGGFVTAAQDVASVFLGDGTVFWQEDASGNLTETSVLPGGPATDPAIKLVVLVDQGSASASEIVAGALHDRGRATLVGETTFGKGTVQQWTPLEDDHGGFRLTIAKWLTPAKTWVHGHGITPDVVVPEPTEPVAGADPALDEALRVLGAPAPLAAEPSSSPVHAPSPRS